VKEIKGIDSIRPLIVDLEVNSQSINHSKMIIDNVKGIDGFGLVVKNERHLNSLIAHLKQSEMEFVFSEIDVDILTQPEIFDTQTSFFITAWQDQHESNKLSFSGIIDRKGRFKTDYFKLLNALQKSIIEVEPCKVRILKPATPIYENTTLNYYAMCYDSIKGWKFGREMNDLNFEWSLVKCDKYGNYLAIKDIGHEAKISIKIPQDQEFYRLLLTTLNGEMITSTITTFYTPLVLR
jgi:hypothetical protein